MATLPLISLILTSSLILGSCAKATQPSHYHTLAIESLLPSTRFTCNNQKAKSTNSIQRRSLKNPLLEVVDVHGPCSPFNASTTSSLATILHETLRHDQSRVAWINSKSSKSTSSAIQKPRATQRMEDDVLYASKDVSLPAYSGISLGTGNYIVNIGLGTPKKDFSVIFDTGSDITWVQCEPCSVSGCYAQQGPRFDPSLSSSYKFATCSSDDCTGLESVATSTGCSSSTGKCIYGVKYGDGSFTMGFFSRDTLTLGSSSDDIIPNFPFGCGQNNKGLFGRTSGLLGLGKTKFSVVSETTTKYSGVFSYCLPLTSSTGFLSFGPESSSSATTFTPMANDPQQFGYYYISLTGIRVAGELIPLAASVLSDPVIIDSGTVITRLPSAAYNALKSAFQQEMKSHNYPAAQPFSILDTCYDLSNYTSINIPIIVLQFMGGAAIPLDLNGILVVASPSQVCLAFASTDSVGIIGNRQQRKIQIVHDVLHSKIGFRLGAC